MKVIIFAGSVLWLVFSFVLWLTLDRPLDVIDFIMATVLVLSGISLGLDANERDEYQGW